MHPLFPFAQHTQKLSLMGSVDRLRSTNVIQCTYEIIDPRMVLRHGPTSDQSVYEKDNLVRADDLWRDTCFELFWSELDHEDYFECNIQANGQWNIYHFDSYRSPQVPRETSEYQVVRIVSEEGRVECTIEREAPLPRRLECGLSAVIMTDSGELFYALTHKGTVPDFHIRESFVVRI